MNAPDILFHNVAYAVMHFNYSWEQTLLYAGNEPNGDSNTEC